MWISKYLYHIPVCLQYTNMLCKFVDLLHIWYTNLKHILAGGFINIFDQFDQKWFWGILSDKIAKSDIGNQPFQSFYWDFSPQRWCILIVDQNATTWHRNLLNKGQVGGSGGQVGATLGASRSRRSSMLIRRGLLNHFACSTIPSYHLHCHCTMGKLKYLKFISPWILASSVVLFPHSSGDFNFWNIHSVHFSLNRHWKHGCWLRVIHLNPYTYITTVQHPSVDGLLPTISDQRIVKGQ